MREIGEGRGLSSASTTSGCWMEWKQEDEQRNKKKLPVGRKLANCPGMAWTAARFWHWIRSTRSPFFDVLLRAIIPSLPGIFAIFIAVAYEKAVGSHCVQHKTQVWETLVQNSTFLSQTFRHSNKLRSLVVTNMMWC